MNTPDNFHSESALKSSEEPKKNNLSEIITDNIGIKLYDIVNLWNDSEELIKKSTLLRKECPIGSINELRYAGRKFADIFLLLIENKAINQKNEDFIYNHINEIKESCQRAKSDAVDASIEYILSYLSEIEKHYGTGLLVNYFPNYLDIKKTISEVCTLMTESRKNRAKRYDLYDEIVNNHLDCLFDFYQKIETSRELIDSDVKKIKEEEEKTKRSTRIAYAIGIVGTIASLASLATVFL